MFQESKAFIKTIEEQYASTGKLDMFAIEEGLLNALKHDGCNILENFFKQHIPDCASQRLPGEYHYKNRSIEVNSVLGKFHLQRDYFYNKEKGCGRAPLDEQLKLKDGITPGLQKLMSRAAAMSGSFEQGSEDLRIYSKLKVSPSSIQRLAAVIGPDVEMWQHNREPLQPEKHHEVMYVSYDGTGVPTTKSETIGRKGKQPDGTSKGREVKLGCVFTQIRRVKGEAPSRDNNSTTYISSFNKSSVFGGMIRREAIIRGMAYAKKTVVIGDGAPWIWEIARVNFPDAICIIDLYHALEHVNDLARLIYPDESVSKAYAEKWKKWLEKDKIDNFIKETTKLADSHKNKDNILKAIKYFSKNRNRMLYKSFAEYGYFVGSGVVEAGCKTVVGKRAKQSGMFWRVKGAQNVLAIRCAILSGLFEDYWEYRNAA